MGWYVMLCDGCRWVAVVLRALSFKSGTQACFILDSASYFGSALCVCAIMAALRSRREYAPVGEDKTGVEMAPTGSATRNTDVDTEDANATLTEPSATASGSARHNEGLCSSMSGGLVCRHTLM